MARALAVGPRGEIDLQFAQFRPLAQIIVPDQAVEVERRRRAGVGLHRGDLGQAAGDIGGGKQRPLGVFEAGALGQVDDHRDLGFVVERQQLDRHGLGGEQGHRQQGRDPDADQEDPGRTLAGDDGGCDATIDPPERAFVVRGMRCARDVVLRRQPQHQPGRHHHRDEEREQHRGGGIGRNRRHIRTHQPRHEQHRQQCGDHGQGRNDGRIADLGDGLDGGLQPGPPVPHRPVAGDVLDHHDGVVDQDAYREDQGEQADAVDGVAHQIRGEHRQQDRGRDHDQRDQRLAPADRDRDQDDDRDRRQTEVKQQLVGLFVRGLAIVPGDGDLDVIGDQARFQPLEPVRNLFGNHHRVGAGALGKRQADRGNPLPLALAVARIVPDAVLDRVGPDDDAGDVLDVDRTSVPRRNQQEADVGNAGQGLARRHAANRAGIADLSGHERAVGVLHLGDELLQRHAEQRQFFRIGLDPDLLGAAAGNVGQADAVDLHQFRAQLVGEFVEILVGPALGGLRLRRKRQHGHGDVVDAAADDQGLGNADRDAVEIGADLLVNAKDGVLGLGSDQEARGDHDAVVFGLAVDVLHAIDALDDGLERLGDQFDRIRAAQAVGVDADVDHGDADLGLFLARNHDHGDHADHQRRQQEQRRQRRTDGGPGQPARQSEIHGCTNWSPGRMPDRISRPSGRSGLARFRPRCTGALTVRSPWRIWT